MINETLVWLASTYSYLPGGYVIPMIGATIGFSYAMYKYVRSFKYLYYHYIETGVVIWWMDDNARKDEMTIVIKKHKLNKHFKNFGYIGGMAAVIPFTVAGIVVGSIWPVAVGIGILTIPNVVLRRVAKDMRSKAIFEQSLKGAKK